MRPKLIQLNPILLSVFTICFLLTTILFIGCGDEGDPPTDIVNGNGDKVTEPDPVDPVDPPIEPPPAPMTSFQDDVAPIIAERCAIAGCHDNAASGGLNLTTYDNFSNGGNSGAAFVAEDGKGSLVVKRIETGEMPPGGPPLNADQIQFFIDWINEGAKNN